MHKNFYKLILVTHRQQVPLEDYLFFIKQCASSGITSVQLREKNANFDFLLTFGARLKNILDPLNIPLIINDDVDLALKLNASGVHLGNSDGDARSARNQLGPDKIIGLSIESESDLHAANKLPVNYVAASAVFKTKNKSDIQVTWGIDGVKLLSKQSNHPLVGIGGINSFNVLSILNAGAKGIAVISALHDAKNPTEMTRTLRDMLDKPEEEK